MMNSKRIVELLEEYKQLKELAEKQSDNLKEALKIIESLQKERNLYKNAWEDLQGFCFRFVKITRMQEISYFQILMKGG